MPRPAADTFSLGLPRCGRMKARLPPHKTRRLAQLRPPSSHCPHSLSQLLRRERGDHQRMVTRRRDIALATIINGSYHRPARKHQIDSLIRTESEIRNTGERIQRSLLGTRAITSSLYVSVAAFLYRGSELRRALGICPHDARPYIPCSRGLMCRYTIFQVPL